MSDAWTALRADLAAETAAFDVVLDGLDDATLGRPSAAEGWTIGDQVAHLAGFDEAAVTAATDPDAFGADLERRLVEGDDPIEGYRRHGRTLTPAELRHWWRTSRRGLLDALAGLDARARVPWYGPPMSAMSHATARLMETWAHGLDIRDVTGHPPSVSERLRHVAHIGVGARAFAFAAHGLEPPEAPIRVELASPAEETWTWGPGDAVDVVSGPALDFCLLVTQRRHRDDLDLRVEGPAATAWMAIAQAFAGPPGTGRVATGR